jgi:hypothetical protein
MRKYAPAAILVAAGIGALVIMRATAPATTSPPPPSTPVVSAPATTELATLIVDDRPPPPGYKRELFGPAWADVDHNGCDQRQDTIMRDTGATRTVRNGACYADMSGHLYVDPYTDIMLTAASQIQIDHVVSLGDAWRSGAAAWTPERRRAYANDLDVLWAVQAKANEQKSDKTPDQWLPPSPEHRCEFGRKYVAIKIKYHLTVTSKARMALADIETTCGS